MHTRVRYAWGPSHIGKFFSAMIGEELVTFGFPANEESALEELHRRFPDATIEEDAIGLAATVADLGHFLNCFKASTLKGDDNE